MAECALRLGFEHITIVDGDKVERSNLNRQNYTENDIGRYKAECLTERLQSINPDAQIDYHTEFLNPDNIEEMLNGHNVAINALDFKDNTPFVFDRICKEKKSPYFIHTILDGRGLSRLLIRWDIPCPNWQTSQKALN